MKFYTILGILVLLVCFGCIQPKSTTIPSDLEITHSFGACHADWGTTTITIDAQGDGVYESTRDGQVEFRKTFKLNEEELLGLLNKIEESGFYSLNDFYNDPGVMDGSCESVFVTKNSSTKSVAVSNTPAPKAYTTAADAIVAIAEDKTK
ncbi:Uncharacterised protein [Candidatus Bilamarchaeum dharawalense]|uniref:DUF6438 domain-containing protein n=1 Tax=Candidatus Bilamarchaeum dharawalense TaxID=2885759 RepID=A0A5E4LSR6_9ARCH|nr:Uncharacterised protein [Candidatus Bilamarchaeum dharawalense]